MPLRQLQDLHSSRGPRPTAAAPRRQQSEQLGGGRRALRLLPLVLGLPGAHVAPAAPTPDLLASPALAAAPAFIGDGGGGPWVSHMANDSARCLPLPPALPMCGHLGIGHTWLPNHLRHGRGEEVQAAAQAWGSLLLSRCHPFLAWFFCLLLAPPCSLGPPPGPPPCRQFCEAVEDACWSRLDGGRLPVACTSLPAQEDGYCVFIGPAAGNWPADALPTLPLCLAR